MAFDKPITRYWYICSPFFFEKQCKTIILFLDFSSVSWDGGIQGREINCFDAVTNILRYLELKVSSKSFEFLNIHI